MDDKFDYQLHNVGNVGSLVVQYMSKKCLSQQKGGVTSEYAIFEDSISGFLCKRTSSPKDPCLEIVHLFFTSYDHYYDYSQMIGRHH